VNVHILAAAVGLLAKVCLVTETDSFLGMLKHSQIALDLTKGKGKHGFVFRLIVITPLRRSGMSCVLKGSQFYLHTSRTYVNEMNHTCLCLPSRSWYSFTDPGGMEG